MKKLMFILCISIPLILSGGAAIACVADSSSNYTEDNAMDFDAWEDDCIQDFTRGRHCDTRFRNPNNGIRSPESSGGSSRWRGNGQGNFNGWGRNFRNSEYDTPPATAGSGNPFWYCGCATIDLSDILTLLSNLNLFAGVYDINDEGQIVGFVNFGGVLYSFFLNPIGNGDTSEVPLPGTLLLLGSSAGLFGIIKRRLG